MNSDTYIYVLCFSVACSFKCFPGACCFTMRLDQRLQPELTDKKEYDLLNEIHGICFSFIVDVGRRDLMIVLLLAAALSRAESASCR